MKLLVCGGRDFDNWPFMRQTLDSLCEEKNWKTTPDEYGNWLPNVFVIAGGAKGADTLAIQWAVINWCNFKEFYADWDAHGKAAGPIRNQQMIDEGKPDYCVAFPTAKSRGTYDMIRRCEKHGIPVEIYKSE